VQVLPLDCDSTIPVIEAVWVVADALADVPVPVSFDDENTSVQEPGRWDTQGAPDRRLRARPGNHVSPAR
jgi:hypothetical protein